MTDRLHSRGYNIHINYLQHAPYGKFSHIITQTGIWRNMYIKSVLKVFPVRIIHAKVVGFRCYLVWVGEGDWQSRILNRNYKFVYYFSKPFH